MTDIWASHSGVAKDSYIDVYNAVSLGEYFLMFRMIVAPPSSGSSSPRRLLDPRDVDKNIFRNVGKSSPNDTASQPLRFESLSLNQNTSWQADRSSASQYVPVFYATPRSFTGPILSQINPVQTVAFYLRPVSKCFFHLCLGLQSGVFLLSFHT